LLISVSAIHAGHLPALSPAAWISLLAGRRHRVALRTRVRRDRGLRHVACAAAFGPSRREGRARVRVFAVSDLHVDYDHNRRWVEQVSRHDFVQDIFLVAGDVSDSLDRIRECLANVHARFPSRPVRAGQPRSVDPARRACARFPSPKFPCWTGALSLSIPMESMS